MKLSLFPLYLLFLFFLCSCGGKEHKKENNLRLHMSTNPTTLDPRKGRLLYDLNVPRMLFEGLTRIDKGGEPILAAAKDVQISSDGKSYTFTLRKAQWSNGDPVTSYDYLYSWQSSLSPEFPSPMASQLFVIENAREIKEGKLPPSKLGVQTPNAETLLVTLVEPTPYFLELTASAICFPINQSMDKKEPNWALKKGREFPVNGPFTLENWEQNDKLVLKKNGSYWDASSVRLDSIEMLIGGDLQTSLNLFERGELDWVGSPLSGLPSDAFPYLKERKIVHFTPIAGTHWYLFNLNNSPCSNLALRKALTLSVNRKALIQHIIQGNQEPAYGPVPSSMFAKGPSLFTDGDTAKAQIFLKQALQELSLNAPEELPPITLLYSRGESTQKVAETLQQQWKEALNINIQLQGVEGKTFFEKRANGEFDLCSANWLGDYNDPINFLELFEAAQNPINVTSWESKDFQKVLLQSRKTLDPKKRSQLLKRAQRIMMKELPILPLYHITLAYSKKKGLQDVVITPTGFLDLKRAYISN